MNGKMNKVTQLESIEQIIKPVLESQGYQLVERELVTDAGRLILRIYIDKLQPYSGVEGGRSSDSANSASLRRVPAKPGLDTALPGGGAASRGFASARSKIEDFAESKKRAPVITKEGGVTLDDCSEVSRTLSAHLDVEDPIPGAYELEISSPGIERPLRYPEDFVRYKGEVIKLKTLEPINGRQNYKGVLTGSDADTIYMEVDGLDFTIPFSALHKARIIKDWGQHKK